MITTQKLVAMALSYPDFRLNDIIDPDQFDTNNEEIVTHINGLVTQLGHIVDDLTAHDGKITTLTTDMGARLSLSTTTKANLVSAINEVLQNLNDFKAEFASKYTATDVLNKLKTVDGAGSGLDADTLQGKAPSYFSPSTHNHDTVYTKKGTIANNMALVSDGSGNVASSPTVSATELGYLDGVTSPIQTQLNGKSASTHNHDGIYAPNTHTHGYLPLSGGTLTGGVALNNGIQLAGKKTDGNLANIATMTVNDVMVYGNATVPTQVNGSTFKYHNGTAINDVLHTGNSYTKTEIDTQMSGKSNTNHTHTISNTTGLQEALDSKLNSSTYTPDDVLNKLKSVDGEGSGLDADMVGGISPVHIVQKSDLAMRSTSVVDSVVPFNTLANSLDGATDVGIKGQTLINLVKNGNFANGTVGWDKSSSTISVSNNVMSVVGNESNSKAWLLQTPTRQYISSIGRKIFLKAKVRVTNPDCEVIALYVNDGTTIFNANIKTTPIQNQWYDMYGVVTLTSSNNYGIYMYHQYADATTSNGKVMEVQEVMALDLTSLGLESKTADEINAMLPNYFEGIASVEDTVIKSIGENLFDINSLKTHITNLNDTRFSMTILDINKFQLDTTIAFPQNEFMKGKFKPNTQYTFKKSSIEHINEQIFFNIIYTDGTIYPFYEVQSTYTTPIGKSISHLSLMKGSGTCTSIYYDFQINEGTAPRPYTPYRESKIKLSDYIKPELFPFRSLPNGVSDEATPSGKVYKRIGKTVLNGSESGWVLSDNTLTNTIRFSIALPIQNKLNAIALCDKFTYSTNVYSSDIEGIQFSASTQGILYLRISRTKVSDLATFKTLLSTNNIEIIYELATPTEHTLDRPISLQIFKNGSMISEPTSMYPALSYSYPTSDVKSMLENKLDKAILGTDMPTVVPEYVGQMYIDTVAKEAYIANGLESTDWQSISKDELGGGSGSSQWGNISGSITDQTDLNNILNNKSDSTHNHDSKYLSKTGGSVSGVVVLDNNIALQGKDASGTPTSLSYVNSSNQIVLGTQTLPILLRSNVTPKYYNGTNSYDILHTGNFDPATKSDVSHNHTSITGSSAKWTTPRTITLSGDLSGSVSIDGSTNVTLSAQVLDNSHNHTNYMPLTGGTATGSIASPNLKNTSGYFEIHSYDNVTYGDGKALMFYDGVNNWIKLMARNADGTGRSNPQFLVENAKVLTETTGVKLSGGTMTGNLYMGNSNVFCGRKTDNMPVTLAWVGSDNVTKFGQTDNPTQLYGSTLRYYNGTGNYNVWHAGNLSPMTTSGGTLYGDLVIDYDYGLYASYADISYIRAHSGETSRPILVSTTTGGKSYIGFNYQDVEVGTVGKTLSDGGANMLLSANNGYAGLYSKDKSVLMDGTNNVFRPSIDNTVTVGNSSYRIKQLYAGTTTISTSDRNHKQQIKPISDDVLDAWSELNYYQYKFNDAVEEKGENARTHFGLIAQDIEEVFNRHGLNAFDYGLLCYDEWDDVYEDVYESVQVGVDENDKPIYEDVFKEKKLIKPKGHIYSVRADECQFLEMALQRRETEKLKEQLKLLTGGN